MKDMKALSKAGTKLLTTLSAQDKNIFTASEAQEVVEGSISATLRLLSRLVEKKWLIRLVGGKYLIVPLSAGEKAEHTENWYVIAKSLIEPGHYYISHNSALDIHEMTIHPSLSVYITSPVRRIPKEILGATFRFVFIQPKDIWGVEDVWVTTSQKVKTSDLEGTIIDCLDRPDLCGGISEVAKGIWAKRSKIDFQKLIDYAKKLGRKSVIKRLGFLLETYGLGRLETLAELKAMLTRSYSPLDPTLPISGHYLGTWKLRINLDPEELKEITKT